MSYREFCESREGRWVWYRALTFAGAMVVAGAGYAGIQAFQHEETLPFIEPVVEPKVEPPSDVPNGGLIVDESRLDFGDVWESDRVQSVGRTLTLTNPWDRDLHVSLVQGTCGYQVSPHEFVVPANGTFDLDIGFRCGIWRPASRELAHEGERPFSVKIKEFPGTHPGWVVRCRVLRAIAVGAVEPTVRTRSFRVIPVRPIVGITADVDGDATGVEVTGPHIGEHYLVQLDQDVVASSMDAIRTSSRVPRLTIRADIDGVNSSEHHIDLRF